MTPQAPEWRRNKGDASLDGELAMTALGWRGYKLEKTYFDKWTGERERWYKAVKKQRISGPQQQVQEKPHDTD